MANQQVAKMNSSEFDPLQNTKPQATDMRKESPAAGNNHEIADSRPHSVPVVTMPAGVPNQNPHNIPDCYARNPTGKRTSCFTYILTTIGNST